MKDNKKLHDLRKQINSLIYEKNLNKYEKYKLNYFIEEYKKTDNDQTPFVYIALTKYYLTLNNIKLALENIKIAESINPDLPSILYLKFRINIRLKDYEAAYEELKNYEQKIKANKFLNIDLSIYYYLLNLILNGNENIEIDNHEYINSVKITDLNFKILWNEFKEGIIAKKYVKSKELILKLNQYCQLHNILLNFDEIDIILNKIIYIEKEKQIKKETKNVNELLNEAYDLAVNNYFSKALEVLQEIRNHIDFKSVSYDYKLIKRYITEQIQIIDIYNSNDAKVYDEIKKSAEINSLCGDNYIACQYYLYGIYKFDIPEFYYKVGKYYLSMGYQYKAVQYFLQYIKKGGFEYLYDAYLCLSHCNAVLNVKERNDFNEKSAKFKSAIKKISNKKVKADNKFLRTKGYGYNEIRPIIIDFGLYPIDKKIQDISTLYKIGYIELAETLYHEFHSEISSDEHLQHLRKKLENDRLFYISQSKQLIL